MHYQLHLCASRNTKALLLSNLRESSSEPKVSKTMIFVYVVFNVFYEHIKLEPFTLTKRRQKPFTLPGKA